MINITTPAPFTIRITYQNVIKVEGTGEVSQVVAEGDVNAVSGDAVYNFVTEQVPPVIDAYTKQESNELFLLQTEFEAYQTYMEGVVAELREEIAAGGGGTPIPGNNKLPYTLPFILS